jgi:AcrR family transcriptional regulator
MVDKEMKASRMKEGFVDATKQILRGEGVRCASARNVAEKAGYSYATLYHYFEDMKDLLFECVQDFQEECAEFVGQRTAGISAGPAKIRALCRCYVLYFIQYPGIFELFFIERAPEIARHKDTPGLIHGFLDGLCADSWSVQIEAGAVSAPEAKQKKRLLNYMLNGLLLMYVNRRLILPYGEFMALVDSQLDAVLGKGGIGRCDYFK